MTSFYPAANGRATSQLGITRLLYQIHRDELSIQDLQTQLSTGRRLNTPSQDPASAIRGLSAQRQLEYKSQIDDNMQSADTILAATGSTLSQAQSILNDIRGVAVESSNSTLSTEERDAYAAQVEAAITKLAELGNAKFRDQYIFSGSDVLRSPLTFSGDRLQFNGNSEELNTLSDFASTIAANVTADDAFGVKSSKVISTVDLNPAITAETPLALLNRRDGVRGGAISFTNGIDLVEIDLANAYTVSDVLERIDATQVGTRSLKASLSSNGINIQYLDGGGGILRVDEVGSGFMAGDLGINNSDLTGLSPVNGTDLNPVVTKSTKLSQLFGGTGINIGDSFRIQQGDRNYFVSTNNLSTVEDLINRVASSGASAQASLDPTGRFLQLQSTESGTSLSIGENNSNLASKLGLRTMDLTTPVSELNFGQGIFNSEQGNDLVITRTNGSTMLVNLSGVLSVGDVINRINNNVDNFTPSLRITASLSTTGNGLVLSANPGSQPIRVKNAGGSEAGWGLGLIPRGQEEAVGSAGGATTVINGADVSGVEVEGVFTSLIRMRQAIEGGQVEDMARVTQALENDIHRMALARGLIGARQQSIERTRDLSAEQQLQLKSIESQELDSDLAEVISQLTARQAALQASLQLMGQSSQLSLFNYL
jgi:flagellar hook-associated protein 3 FlgL